MSSARNAGFAELHCKTNFSFLQGASHGEELVARAKELGLAALAITDRNSLAGVVRPHVAAKEADLKLLIGAEITPEDAPTVLLYATDRAAYGRLSRLITRGRRSAQKGDCRLHFDDVAEHADGLLAAVVLPARATPDDSRHLARYRAVFGGRCYLTAAVHNGPDDPAILDRRQTQARQARLPLLATNDVHYHVPQRRILHDVVTAIRHGVPIAQLGVRRFPNGERHLKSPEEMAALFHACPRALAHTVELAARCTFSLDELKYEYPEELCPPGQTPSEYLAQLTWEGAAMRYPGGVPEKITTSIRRELQLIAELRYEAYFLTVWAASSARAAAPPPIPPSAIASASLPSIPTAPICSSSASLAGNATKPPISTSISSTSAARK
jgi:error-prone DNA polymerase